MLQQEEIDMCLRCPLPKCVDCVGNPMRYAKLRRNHDVWKAQVKELAGKEMPDGWIADQIGISSATVAKLRKELGIPPFKRGGARGRPKKTV